MQLCSKMYQGLKVFKDGRIREHETQVIYLDGRELLTMLAAPA